MRDMHAVLFIHMIPIQETMFNSIERSVVFETFVFCNIP